MKSQSLANHILNEWRIKWGVFPLVCSYATDRWVSRGVDAEGDDLVVAGELGGGGSIVDVFYILKLTLDYTNWQQSIWFGKKYNFNYSTNTYY